MIKSTISRKTSIYANLLNGLQAFHLILERIIGWNDAQKWLSSFMYFPWTEMDGQKPPSFISNTRKLNLLAKNEKHNF